MALCFWETKKCSFRFKTNCKKKANILTHLLPHLHHLYLSSNIQSRKFCRTDLEPTKATQLEFKNLQQRVSSTEQLHNKPASSQHHNMDTPSSADMITLIGFLATAK